MPLFKWKDEYSVNYLALDQHHKVLMDIINRIYDNCMQVEAVNCIGPKVSELVEYSEYHFAAEEKYMRLIEYYETDEHIEQHSMFIFKIKELQQACTGNELELTQSLIVFLGKWLLNHVFVEDRKYAAHANAINIKPDGSNQ